MSGSTPRLGLKTPVDSDPFLTVDFDNNYQLLDSYPGVFVCTSVTLPSWTTAQAGMPVFCTDTRTLLTWSGTAWQEPLVAPSAWNLFTSIATSVSSGSTTSFSLGSIASTRAGEALIVVQLNVQPFQSLYAVNLSFQPVVNGGTLTGASGYFAQYGQLYSGAGVGSSAVSPPGGSPIGLTCTGLVAVVAGANPVDLSVFYHAQPATGVGGGPPTAGLVSAVASLVMVNSVDT